MFIYLPGSRDSWISSSPPPSQYPSLWMVSWLYCCFFLFSLGWQEKYSKTYLFKQDCYESLLVMFDLSSILHRFQITWDLFFTFSGDSRCFPLPKSPVLLMSQNVQLCKGSNIVFGLVWAAALCLCCFQTVLCCYELLRDHCAQVNELGIAFVC